MESSRGKCTDYLNQSTAIVVIRLIFDFPRENNHFLPHLGLFVISERKWKLEETKSQKLQEIRPVRVRGCFVLDSRKGRFTPAGKFDFDPLSLVKAYFVLSFLSFVCYYLS